MIFLEFPIAFPKHLFAVFAFFLVQTPDFIHIDCSKDIISILYP